ncbi:carboxypeptidase-like regulatory domain-containing protein [Cellulophaga sp. L1A9]|uniref:carboxypeptidase-like regulatory domain-containing protein n=1 Tax=Cellulophaga sp. L1A9 TaxID=2686362 RepID=UPI00131D3165|nr:carboxypeptidase-like regulatory domain-containing protein [Cellulophaga sp. L1A9]
MPFKIICKLLFLLLILSSCGVTKHVQRYAVEGYIVDANNTPINNVVVKFLLDENQQGIMLLSDKDSTITNDEGFYKFKEISATKIGFMGGDKTKSLPVSYTFIARKKGFVNDTVNLRSRNPLNNILIIETIHLKPD